MRRAALPLLALGLASAFAAVAVVRGPLMGRQPDGTFLVSSGQRIEPGTVPFRGRPADLALHPKEDLVAVLNKNAVFLIENDRVVEGSNAPLGANASYRGLLWLDDATLAASTDKGHVQLFVLRGRTLAQGETIAFGGEDNPLPAGLTLSPDGNTLYIALTDRNEVAEVDWRTRQVRRTFPTQMLPFEPRVSADGRWLVASNWGGRPPEAEEDEPKEKTMVSGNRQVLVDERGLVATGSVSVVDLRDGSVRHVPVGLHPSALAVDGTTAYVANSSSDTISRLDLPTARVTATHPIAYGRKKLWGSMPVALEVHRGALYACDGGDNALAELDLATGRVRGFRPAGYYPVSVALREDTAWVLNSKGNGSVANTLEGKPGNAHDFQGTVSRLDLRADLARATARVADHNGWDRRLNRPKLKVYNGAIKHVLYIIKENRTYDEIYGDLPQGNGDPKLCSIGETVMPNHRKLVQEYTLFDNGYVSGTNSSDGHQWSTQSVCNDYLERMYVNYARSYGDDGEDAMTISPAGGLWDAAVKKGLKLRVYGEFCDDQLSRWDPRPPKDWFEMWEDRKSGKNAFKCFTDTRVAGLRPYIHPNVHYWPLIMSDQHRADVFIREMKTYLATDSVPNLMILSLPCDHTEGTDPKYPSPRAMMADNDLALGRVVSFLSRSKIWRETAVFVIEDDAQSGPDHVDGHRTNFQVFSPYNRRGNVDSSFYTTVNMVRSIEMMLGLDPMNRFDALARPIEAAFHDEPDLTPYAHVPNRVPLDEPNPGRSGEKLSERDAYWLEKTRSLDWSLMDRADPYWLNRIVWASLVEGRPYPAREGERPGQTVDADD